MKPDAYWIVLMCGVEIQPWMSAVYVILIYPMIVLVYQAPILKVVIKIVLVNGVAM
jgi:hypothetical protein